MRLWDFMFGQYLVPLINCISFFSWKRLSCIVSIRVFDPSSDKMLCNCYNGNKTTPIIGIEVFDSNRNRALCGYGNCNEKKLWNWKLTRTKSISLVKTILSSRPRIKLSHLWSNFLSFNIVQNIYTNIVLLLVFNIDAINLSHNKKYFKSKKL